MKSLFLLFCFAFFTDLSSATEESKPDEVAQLYDAINLGNVSAVQSLIDRGVPLNGEHFREDERHRWYPLHAAVGRDSHCYHINEEILKLLLKNGADAEVYTLRHKTPLHLAIACDNEKAVKFLLENGANPNAYLTDYVFNKYMDTHLANRTTLHYAIYNMDRLDTRHGGDGIMNLLIEHGADVNAIINEDESTPLHEAIDWRNKHAIDILIEKGAANVNAVNKWKMTPLHSLMVSDGHRGHLTDWNEFDRSEYAEKLINHGADVNQTDVHGKTPLHYAIIKGQGMVIELLIERGSNVNAVENEQKMTPLHFLALDHHFSEDNALKYAELLINHGADVYAKASIDGDDKTALDLATSKKVRKLLGSKMGFTGWLRTIWG